jgi:AcrR family transcriptional regulator
MPSTRPRSSRSTVSPRREPAQARSTATRAAIVEAAARVLETHGLSAFNTNRVAEVAGISIGSLYQYYPHKAALLLALGEQQTAGLVDRFDEAIARLGRATLARGIRALIDVALEHQFERPQLAAALDYAERELPMSPTVQLHRQALLASLVSFLAQHRDEVAGDLRHVATDLQTIVQALIDGAALRGEPHGKALRMRVERAALGYLGHRAASSTAPRSRQG